MVHWTDFKTKDNKIKEFVKKYPEFVLVNHVSKVEKYGFRSLTYKRKVSSYFEIKFKNDPIPGVRSTVPGGPYRGFNAGFPA